MKELNRGDIIYVDLGQHMHSCVQSGVRPCVVIGIYPSSPVANVCPLTSRMDKKGKPVHVKVNKENVCGYIEKPSLILIEQTVSIDRRKIISKIGHIPEDSEVMELVDEAIVRQMLSERYKNKCRK